MLFVRQVPEGSGDLGKMEKNGYEIICGAPTTLAAKKFMMIMMMVMIMMMMMTPNEMYPSFLKWDKNAYSRYHCGWFKSGMSLMAHELILPSEK